MICIVDLNCDLSRFFKSSPPWCNHHKR